MNVNLSKGTKIAGLIGVGVFVAFFNLIAATLIVKYGWQKISFILFPGFVEKGDINSILSFLDAFLVVFVIYTLKTALGKGVATIDETSKNKLKDSIKED